MRDSTKTAPFRRAERRRQVAVAARRGWLAVARAMLAGYAVPGDCPAAGGWFDSAPSKRWPIRNTCDGSVSRWLRRQTVFHGARTVSHRLSLPEFFLAAKAMGRRSISGWRKPAPMPLAGHAWLTCGDTVVTGGEELDTEIHRLGEVRPSLDRRLPGQQVPGAPVDA